MPNHQQLQAHHAAAAQILSGVNPKTELFRVLDALCRHDMAVLGANNTNTSG